MVLMINVDFFPYAISGEARCHKANLNYRPRHQFTNTAWANKRVILPLRISKLIRIDMFFSITYRINFDLVPSICLQIYTIGLTIRPQSWHSVILLRFGSLELHHQTQGQTTNPIQCYPPQ